MYDNIGSKIKNLAVWLCIIMSSLGVIAGIALWASLESAIYALIILIVPIVSWISSWLLYGFGELIDHTADIDYRLIKLYSHFCESENQSEISPAVKNKTKTEEEKKTDRTAKIDSLYSKGLITEEEYKQALSE